MAKASNLLIPDNHKVSTKSISGFCILREQGVLNMEPDYQRGYVWTLEQKQNLIDSIFSKLPIPAIFLIYKKQEQISEVFDGKQRLSAIFGFMDGDFSTSQGETYDGLKSRERFAFNRVQIPLCELVDPPREVLLDYFKRINTGGTAWQQNF